MKCTCEICKGAGFVPCSGCEATGEFESSVEFAKLVPDSPGFAELTELQADARRVRVQALQMKALIPERAAAYDDQLSVALAEIDAKATQAQATGRKLL